MNIRVYDPHNILGEIVFSKALNIDLLNISTTKKYVSDVFTGSGSCEKHWQTIHFADEGKYAEVAIEGNYDHVEVISLKNQYEILLIKDIWNTDMTYTPVYPEYVQNARELLI